MSQPATKEDIRVLRVSIERQFATKDDFRELRDSFAEQFATKQDFQALRDSFSRQFATKQDLTHTAEVLERKIDSSEQRITQAFASAVDELAHKAEVANVQYRLGVVEQRLTRLQA